MPQLDSMSFFSQFIWFSIIFINIYAFILKHVMCSIVTNLKFRIKKFDVSSNTLITNVKGLFYVGIVPLHDKYDILITSSIVCSKSISVDLLHKGFIYFLIPIQKFNNTTFLSAHAKLISSELDFKVNSKIN